MQENFQRNNQRHGHEKTSLAVASGQVDCSETTRKRGSHQVNAPDKYDNEIIWK